MAILETIFTARAAVSKKRIAICDDCEFYDKRIKKCEKCGCFMEYKTLMMSSSCPINKWGKEE